MTKVCCFCETWSTGGIESFLINTFDKIGFEDLEIDVVVAKLESDVQIESLKKIGVNFYELTGSTHRILANQRAFRRLQREKGYDVIHLNIYHAVSLHYCRLSQKCGIKKRIVHSHNTGLRPGLTRWAKMGLHRLASQIWGRSATDWWTCSRMAAKFMYPAATAVRAKMVANGIPAGIYAYDEQVRNEMRGQLQMKDSFVIGQVGRLCAQKNQLFMLNAFAEVFHRCPNAKLLLAGVGEDQKMLERKAKELGILDSVMFYGFTKSIHKLMQAMDVLVLPSLFEGLGIVAIEAQAAGLPVICSSNIPQEADVTGSLEYLSLTSGEAIWAERILKMKDVERKDGSSLVEKAGYDSADIAGWVRRNYLGENV